MSILNVEIKAKSGDQSKIRELLKSKNAVSKGVDHQIDTYFNVKQGRLKLREGNIENNLIHYIREDKKGPKQSKITLFKSDPNSTLKDILSNSIGILTVVDKKREIYYIDNVKFHIDGEVKLLKQCESYLELFDISKDNLVSVSYSDLILEKKNTEL